MNGADDVPHPQAPTDSTASMSDGRIARTIQPFRSFSPGEWAGVAPPPVPWMVEGCFIRGTVAMVSGDGGLGKSLLMQQLLTAAAIGVPWLGLETKRVRGYGFFCEDDKGELHRRQERINAHYRCTMDSIAEDIAYAEDRVGADNSLVTVNPKTKALVETPVFSQIRKDAKDFGAQIVVLDPLQEIFDGDERFRNQTFRFISMLRRFAREIDGIVIISAHPSVAGMASGSGLSGSTAWHNSVRSRLYLTAHGGDRDQPTNERLLRTMKQNAGAYGGRIGLLWEGGVFVRIRESGPAGLVERLDAEQRVIQAVRDWATQGDPVPAKANSPKSLAKRLKRLPDWRTWSMNAVNELQKRMLAEGKLETIEAGPPSKRRTYLRPAGTL